MVRHDPALPPSRLVGRHPGREIGIDVRAAVTAIDHPLEISPSLSKGEDHDRIPHRDQGESGLGLRGSASRSRRAAANSATWAFVCLGAALGCAQGQATPAELRAYRDLRGTLVGAETSAASPRGRYAAHRVRLRSNTGLVATGRLLRPVAARAGCYPAVLLQNGREENSGVIGRLPPEFGDVVVLALDYPEEIPYVIRLRDVVLHGERLRRAAQQIPARFSLGASYLSQRPDVDTARLAIAATSFAVPFATIAAAADHRFRNVALVYGAGDLTSVLAANIVVRPGVLRRPAAWLATRPFASFFPERFIGLIAPRPVVMVNGVDDPQMPVKAVERLYRAARPPKELIWLRTGHLMPTDSALIRTLVDTALARLPVLHAAGDTARCGR
ncbi:MAG: hypothetical protein ABR499_22015 [Gemmatimonadaceae bacterium]